MAKKESEEKKVVNVIPEIAGANITEEVKSVLKNEGKKPVIDIDLDMDKVEILDLLKRAGERGIRLKFHSDSLPDLNSGEEIDKEIRGLMDFESTRDYMLERDAYEAELVAKRQKEDEKFIGSKIEFIDEPHWKGQFALDDEALKKQKEQDLIIKHIRPDEFDKFKRAGHISLGTVEGTPVGPPNSDLSRKNMIRVGIPKEVNNKMEKAVQERSRRRITDNPFIEIRKERMEMSPEAFSKANED